MSDDNLIGEVDLDKSSIEVNNEWKTTEDLKALIKSQIESGDFDVTLYADALKKLEKTLKTLRKVKVRMPISVLNGYKEMADDTSKSLESCLRIGVTKYLEHHDKLKLSKDAD